MIKSSRYYSSLSKNVASDMLAANMVVQAHHLISVLPNTLNIISPRFKTLAKEKLLKDLTKEALLFKGLKSVIVADVNDLREENRNALVKDLNTMSSLFISMKNHLIEGEVIHFEEAHQVLEEIVDDIYEIIKIADQKSRMVVN